MNISLLVVGITRESFTYALTDGIVELYIDNHIVQNIAYNGSGCYTLPYTVTQSEPQQSNTTEIVLKLSQHLSNSPLFTCKLSSHIHVEKLPCPK